ncbi:ribose 5-phosphate isomerase B [Quadrisphaera granulorum]|uniref:Ribose-5-phosphate isomerase B n=1 Tax=Quadrisphaera granulorum TaxID=317664 RepID=A0A315ZPC1_9ACTN|nr:ribose-5-phosphate isomerase [Quadrisphaera granulorum]PWJ47356.1 ribose 5-phosphate isomerase B [Quadrisphaera granulorum]SZE98803.1 ribose 5-phosphate isomerase B [Quadrisphaera granulorum]
MRVHIASDHAAFELKQHLVQHLSGTEHEVVDHGPAAYDALDDYPTYCIPAALGVRADVRAGVEALGIVLGGSGNGEQLAANRVPGIRAALAWSLETAQLARQHNDAHIVSVGARMHSLEEATAIVDAFLATPFSNDPRHQRRLDAMTAWETEHLTER